MIFYQPGNSRGNYNYNIIRYTNRGYSLHFHKNFEIYYAVKGEIPLEINGISGTLREGEFAIALPNQLHSFFSDADSELWVGVFSEDFIKEFSKMTAKKEGTKLSFRCTDVELTYLKSTLLSEDAGDVLSIKSSLYMICNRYMKEVPLVKSDDAGKETAHLIIKEMEEKFNTDISLKSIAETLGYEYHYLSRLFRKIFRMSFPDVLNQYRFEHARYLIISTDKSMSEIAHECGFGSIRNFNRIYKQISGITPIEEKNKKV